MTLKVGDWGGLPFGKDDVLRQGQVKAIMDCTRMVAPWPPEQTKNVIRAIDAPAIMPVMEGAALKTEERIESPEKKTAMWKKAREFCARDLHNAACDLQRSFAY